MSRTIYVHISAIEPFKSSILFGGSCPEDTIEVIKNVLGVTSSDFEEIYLGLRTHDGLLTKGKLKDLQVKLSKWLFSFDGHPMQAGKEALIKSVAESIPTFIMSVFKFPFGVCDDLNTYGSELLLGNGER